MSEVTLCPGSEESGFNQIQFSDHTGYTPEATTWVKIKNREYSQAFGREDFFDRRTVRE
jgi:hypothetical protein